MLQRVLPSPVYRVLAIVGLGVVMSANLSLLYRHHRISHDVGYPHLDLPGTPVSWSSYEGVFHWLRTHSRPDDVVAAGLDPLIYLYTGRRAFHPYVDHPTALFYAQHSPPVGTVEELRHSLKAARYLVHSPLPGAIEGKAFAELLDELRRKYPGWLTPVYEGEDRRFIIFEVQPRMEPASKVQRGAFGLSIP
jgi:hypothetical protein